MLSQQNHAGITETAARAYTATGVTLTRTDGRGNTTTIRTDLAGRAVSVTDAAGNETVTQYDACHDLAAVVTDALGNTVCAGYDARGRKTAEWGTGTQPLLLGYDEADRLVSLTTFRAAQEGDVAEDPTGRANGDVTTWSYDEATGLETRKTYADGTHVDKTWDAFNRLATETNARGIVKTCTYEQARGLPAGISYSDATPGQSFSYNHLGQLTQITDASGTRTFACNPYGEPETDCLEANGLSWQVSELYDGLGRPAGYELSAGERRVQQARLSYDGKGRLSALAAEGMETPFSWTYCEQGGLVEQLAYPNGMTRVNTYEDSRDLLSVIDYRRPGSANPPARHEYDYDALGRPTRRRDTWNTAAPKTTRLFTYNSRGELVGDQLRPGGRFGYQYDNIGNRKEAFEFGNTTDYETDELNRYAGIVRNGGEAFTPQYDADGNQTLIRTSTGIWQVSYNAENRPVRFVNESAKTVVECTYDSMGRRFEKKVTVGGTTGFHARYLYRDYLQVAECDLTGETPALVRSYLWDPSEPEATRVLARTRWEANGTQVKEHLYCMHDAMKNVTSLFGEARGRRALYEYRPYGGLVTSEGNMAQENKFRFSCEYMDDELGLIYYNYRHLNPNDGRWISRDPIAEQGGWNLFAFVKNNSIINFDYLGEKTIPKDTPIITITIKRKTIKWKQLVRENVFKKLEGEEEDAYGHWWVELGNESYGWWPAKGVDLLSTLTGVPGYLNGTLDAHAAGIASMTRDAHHGDTADYEFHPVLNTGIFFSTFMKYGKEKEKKCCNVTEDGIKSCIRKFASSYSGSWSYPWGQNCHSFQEEMMDMCCIKEP